MPAPAHQTEKPPNRKPPNRKPQSETSFSMRISRRELALIDDAAVVLGKSRTEFVLDSARRHAVDVLLDQRLFVLAPKLDAKGIDDKGATTRVDFGLH